VLLRLPAGLWAKQVSDDIPALIAFREGQCLLRSPNELASFRTESHLAQAQITTNAFAYAFLPFSSRSVGGATSLRGRLSAAGGAGRISQLAERTTARASAGTTTATGV